MKVLFILGLITLCFNVFRFLLGNYGVLKGEYPLALKVWNVIESIGISIVLVILILNYYK